MSQPGEIMTLQERLERLLNAYSHQYDIEREVAVDGVSFPATATYYLRDENYLLSRKHVLNAVENHDYTYFYLTEQLDAETLQRQIDITRQAGLNRIKPGREHMSSLITLVILADVIDPEAKQLIRKTRFHKYFRLAFYGWAEYRIAAMECSTDSFFSNMAGREVKRTLEQNFNPKPKVRKESLIQ